MTEFSPRYEHYFVVRAFIDENGYVKCLLDSSVIPPTTSKVVFDNDEGKWFAPVDEHDVFDVDKRIHTHIDWCLNQNNYSADNPEPF